MTLIEAGQQAAARVGIIWISVPQDGNWHPTPAAGKGLRNRAGRIKLFVDGEGGQVWNHITDEYLLFWAKSETTLTLEDQEGRRKRSEVLRNQYAKERQQEASIAKDKANVLWQEASPAPSDHPYLKRKQIKAHSVRSSMGRLVIPVRGVDGALHGLQFIGPDSDKKFLSGTAKAGHYYSIGGKPTDSLYLVEGFATAATIYEATGEPTAVCFDAGNMKPVAEVLRAKFPQIKLIICSDDDHMTEVNYGLTKATEAAKAVGGLLAVPDFTGVERGKGDSDFNDLARLAGHDAVLLCLGRAVKPSPFHIDDKQIYGEVSDSKAIVSKLASLSLIEYDRNRKVSAETLGVRATVLDSLVKEARRDVPDKGIGIDDVDPWPEPVDSSKLLSQISATVLRFIVCDHTTAHAVALWAAMTWLIDVVQVAPLAVITAPEKRCGKSQLLFLLGRFVCRPLTASNITPAALFRSIDAWKPTLLVDEADAFMRDNEELRGLLNCGHTRDSAYIVRVVGENHIPTKFNVWGAKALAGIGKLADTIMDRSIILELRRKLPSEVVDKLRYAEPGLFEELSAKLARFAVDHKEDVMGARPELPEQLNDRAQDNWEPLLAIAGVAGGEWPERARQAAIKLSGCDSPVNTVGTELLFDIQEIFESKSLDRISTAELIKALCEDDEKPWATYNRGRSITPRQISTRLKEYGITSKSVRIGYSNTPKGFMFEQFMEAFARYIVPPEKSATTPPSTVCAGFDVADDPQRCGSEILNATLKPNVYKGCGSVAVNLMPTNLYAEDFEEVPNVS